MPRSKACLNSIWTCHSHRTNFNPSPLTKRWMGYRVRLLNTTPVKGPSSIQRRRNSRGRNEHGEAWTTLIERNWSGTWCFFFFCRYYRTTDCHPVLATDKCAEKTDQAATRFWAEIFGTIHIGIAFVTAFILQLLRFVLYSVIRPLTVGILQLIADYFIKPLLSILFNALVQPVLILLYNIATSLRDLCEPIAEAMGLFLREIANLCAAIRLVEVKHVHAPTTTACTWPCKWKLEILENLKRRRIILSNLRLKIGEFLWLQQ